MAPGHVHVGRSRVLVSLLLWAACGAPSSPEQAWPAQRVLYELAFAGCAVIESGRACRLTDERRLTFWSTSGRKLLAGAAGQTLPWEAQRSVEGGQQYTLRVPAAVRRVQLRVQGDGTATRSFELRSELDAPVLSQARALRAHGQPGAAKQMLEAAWAALSGLARARAGALLARIAIDEGRIDDAVVGLRATLAAGVADGRTSDAIEDALALSFVSSARLHRYAEAGELLTRAAELAAADPASRAQILHFQGLLDVEVGDLGGALAHFAAAAHELTRVGLLDRALFAREQHALALSSLGRHAQAIEAQRRVVAELGEVGPCRRVDPLESLYWLVLLSAPPRGGALAQEASALDRSIERALAACPIARKRRNHGLNVALFELQQGRVDDAQTTLRRLERLEGGEDSALLAWAAEASGRVQLARGQTAEAHAAFARALAVSRSHGLWDNELLALVGLGRAARAAHDLQGAARHYGEAERLLSVLSGALPLDSGPLGFLGEREACVRELCDVLVELGEVERALAVARRARARLLATGSRSAWLSGLAEHERGRWLAAVERYRSARAQEEQAVADRWKSAATQLAAADSSLLEHRAAARDALNQAWRVLQRSSAEQDDELPSLAPEEGLLACFPAAGTAWLCFFAAHGATRAVRVPAVDLDLPGSSAGSRLLAPFASELASVGRLRVVVASALSAIDLHAVELNGEPLLSRLPVAYGSDLPTLHTAQEDDAGSALIIGNPTGDLPGSELEAREVARQLAARAPVLLIRGAATRSRVLASLPHSALLHYAGHGFFEGATGVEAGLRVADGSLLAADLLLLERVPGQVILSSCEASREPAVGLTAGFGLAQSFIVRGARAVLSPTRRVQDAQTRRLLADVYAALAQQCRGELPCAARVAQLHLRATDPTADWASFRVVVR